MAIINTDVKLIEEVINRSVDKIYPSKDEFKKKLQSGEQLTVYVGIDPTADYVHLGHSTNYIILKRLHDLGHKIIVLVGDFTAMIGDPSDKTSMRVKLTKQQVQENLQSFKSQIGKILDFEDVKNPIEFKFNSDWLADLSFSDAVDLASNFTVQQMIERDAFQIRLKKKKPLYVHEFFYPLMQGYDSVALDVDVEIGGTDQTFNMLAGRTLQKRYKDKEKFVITTTLLENPKTGEKLMSKSLGTGIGLDESSTNMFGKIMALPDEGIVQCFVDCTYLSLDEISEIEIRMKNGENPKDIKMRLAQEIVKIYHNKELAQKAKNDWILKFSERSKDYVPENLETLSLATIIELAQNQDASEVLSAIIVSNVAESNNKARTLIEQGAFKLNGEKVIDQNQKLKAEDIIRIGKKNYFKIVP